MTSARQSPDRRGAAIVIMVLAQCALALSVITGRLAQGAALAAAPLLPPPGVSEMLLARSLPMTLLCLALLHRRHRRGAAALPRGTLPWLVVRGCVGSLGTLCFYYGGLTIPVGVNQLFLNSSAFFTGLLAYVFLGEVLTRARVVLMALGFAGVALVLGDSLLHPGQSPAIGFVASFASALCTSTAMFSIRKIKDVPSEAIVLSLSAVGLGLSLAGFALLGVHLPRDGVALFHLCASGLCGLVSQFGTTWAMRKAPAALVSPAQFAGPVFSMALGAALFAEPLGPVKLCGAGMAVLFGVLIPLHGELRALLARGEAGPGSP